MAASRETRARSKVAINSVTLPGSRAEVRFADVEYSVEPVTLRGKEKTKREEGARRKKERKSEGDRERRIKKQGKKERKKKRRERPIGGRKEGGGEGDQTSMIMTYRYCSYFNASRFNNVIVPAGCARETGAIAREALLSRSSVSSDRTSWTDR